MTWACPRCRENQEQQPEEEKGEDDEPEPVGELEALHEVEEEDEEKEPVGELEAPHEEEEEDEVTVPDGESEALNEEDGEGKDTEPVGELEALHEEEEEREEASKHEYPLPILGVAQDEGDDLLSLTARLEALHQEECGGNDSFLFAKPMLPQAGKKVPLESELICQAGKKWRRSMTAAKLSQLQQTGQPQKKPPRASFIIVPTTPVRSRGGAVGDGGVLGAASSLPARSSSTILGTPELSSITRKLPRPNLDVVGEDLSKPQPVAEPVRSLLKPLVEIIEIPESPEIPSLTVKEPRTAQHQEDSGALLVRKDGKLDLPRPSNSRQSISQLLTSFSLSEAEAGEDSTISKLLSLCSSTEIVQFDHIYDEKVLAKSSKLGEGAFGEVFAMGTAAREQPVLKVVPVGGKVEVNGFEQTTLEEISSEVLISTYLSGLRSGQVNSCAGFVELRKSFVFRGNYPKKLLELWDKFEDKNGTENDRPDVFSEDQLYIGLEYGNGGKDLEKYVFKNPDQAFSAWNQVAHTLAVAEHGYKFEHRDLHWGNVLIKDTKEKYISFVINGDTFLVETGGVKTHIIDFSLSRLEDEEGIVFKDLSQDPDLFRGQGVDKGGDYQFDVYRLQKTNNKDNWEKFSPKTNIFWLQYLIKKMIQGVHYPKKSKKTTLFNKKLNKLKDIEKNLFDYVSASEYVMKNKK